MKHAQRVGADAVMAIPPVSVILGEAELAGYYRRIPTINIPVIVQDASGYVGRPMSIAMQARCSTSLARNGCCSNRR
jgi:4-hydroxy-tetrahydrodipicolinate synthase